MFSRPRLTCQVTPADRGIRDSRLAWTSDDDDDADADDDEDDSENNDLVGKRDFIKDPQKRLVTGRTASKCFVHSCGDLNSDRKTDEISFTEASEGETVGSKERRRLVKNAIVDGGDACDIIDDINDAKETDRRTFCSRVLKGTTVGRRVFLLRQHRRKPHSQKFNNSQSSICAQQIPRGRERSEPLKPSFSVSNSSLSSSPSTSVSSFACIGSSAIVAATVGLSAACAANLSPLFSSLGSSLGCWTESSHLSSPSSFFTEPLKSTTRSSTASSSSPCFDCLYPSSDASRKRSTSSSSTITSSCAATSSSRCSAASSLSFRSIPSKHSWSDCRTRSTLSSTTNSPCVTSTADGGARCSCRLVFCGLTSKELTSCYLHLPKGKSSIRPVQPVRHRKASCTLCWKGTSACLSPVLKESSIDCADRCGRVSNDRLGDLAFEDSITESGLQCQDSSSSGDIWHLDSFDQSLPCESETLLRKSNCSDSRPCNHKRKDFAVEDKLSCSKPTEVLDPFHEETGTCVGLPNLNLQLSCINMFTPWALTKPNRDSDLAVNCGECVVSTGELAVSAECEVAVSPGDSDTDAQMDSLSSSDLEHVHEWQLLELDPV